MKQTTATAGAREKRGFFRINEDLLLDYHAVETQVAESEEASTQFPESAMLDLFTAFRRIDSENARYLHAVSEMNRSAAEYLVNLNKKIDILAQHVVADKNRQTPLKTTQVNLSEGGIAFVADKAIYKGCFLALRLLFLPSYVSIALFAKVIRSESKDDQRHHIAAKFHRVHEQQRQLLSKHIMRAQINAKRRFKR